MPMPMPMPLTSDTADLRRLVSLACDFYWQQDAAGRFVEISGAAREAGRIDGSAWLGRTADEVGLGAIEHGHWPDTRQPGTPVRDRVVSWRRNDGALRFLRISAEPLVDARGKMAGWHGLAWDVTEERARFSELRQLRAAVDASHIMFFVVDRETMRFVYANDRACELVGSDRDSLLATPPHELLLVDHDVLVREYDDVIAHGGATSENFSRTTDGQRSIIEKHRCALCVDGRWLIVSAVNDISDRWRAEQARDRMARLYASLSATNEAILRASTPEDLYDEVCAAAATGEDIVIASILLPTRDG